MLLAGGFLRSHSTVVKPQCDTGHLGMERERRRGVTLPARAACCGARGDARLSMLHRPGQPLGNTFYSEILELGTAEVQTW